MNFIYKSAPIGDEIIDLDEKNNIVKGYGSYFDNKDSDMDIIRRGAYQKTIQENGQRVKYYINTIRCNQLARCLNYMKMKKDWYLRPRFQKLN